ncbi:L-tyrosine 3-hydroxylase [Streptomyces sp. 8N706]|uniref:L-tyrosine 3-hydroxylase n=1 Tax=Streptomyces sp. 8N706 TaxID=3457416 RepID=UPI003FCF627E
MNLSDNKALSSALPTSGSWEFGGHIYGLEPLALPTTWLPRNCRRDIHRAVSPEQLMPDDWLATPHEGAVSDLVPVDDSEVDRLFWFRWITGHQATFILWQLLAATVDEARCPDADPDELARSARRLVRGYSLMLLYTSSPPREMYERIIRDPMARQHPNLSGSWARDYADVRPLIRGKASLGGEAEATALALECELNERVHEGIAARVVPSGVSLLLTPGIRHEGVRRLHRETLLWLYDGIFLTTRIPVTYDVVMRQFIRRIHAIHLDVSANGLYPTCAPQTEAEPAELLSSDVLALKNSFAQTLRDLAELTVMPGAEPEYEFSTP